MISLQTLIASALLMLTLHIYDCFQIKSVINNVSNKFSRLRDQLTIKDVDWIGLFGYTLEKIEKIRQTEFDITSGAYLISLPGNHEEEIAEFKRQPQHAISLVSIFDGKTTNTTYLSSSSVTPVYRFHQFSKTVLQKFPDSALFGLLALSSLELIKRQINSDTFISLPPLLKEAANITSENLNAKLSMLSALSWDVDLFSKSELEALQTQQLEVIEKYILKELLPKIDKDLSPLLLKLIADPQKISIVTKMINQFIQETASALDITVTSATSSSYYGGRYNSNNNNSSNSISSSGYNIWGYKNNNININRNNGYNTLIGDALSIQATASKIVESVDKVGSSFEGVVKDWNKGLMDLQKITKGEVSLSLTHSARQLWSSLSYKHLHLSINNTILMSLPTTKTYELPNNMTSSTTTHNTDKHRHTNNSPTITTTNNTPNIHINNALSTTSILSNLVAKPISSTDYRITERRRKSLLSSLSSPSSSKVASQTHNIETKTNTNSNTFSVNNNGDNNNNIDDKDPDVEHKWKTRLYERF